MMKSRFFAAISTAESVNREIGVKTHGKITG
jgi:hypothetical protein